jgi:hypothetical protein
LLRLAIKANQNISARMAGPLPCFLASWKMIHPADARKINDLDQF